MSAFKVFLSHRYESPEVNLFFFGLFSKQAKLHFEVDEKKSSINVTRLERMLRGADAFIGIYPFPGAPGAGVSGDELLHESRYFRLELDLAIRAGKPALICSDKRYKDLLKGPATFASCEFDSQEVSTVEAISAPQSVPSAGEFRNTFSIFCKSVKACMDYRSKCPAQRKAKVGILLPPAGKSDTGYDDAQLATIDRLLRKSAYSPVHIPWPSVFDRELLADFATFDWMMADVGDTVSAAAVAFMHGQFIPTMRLKRIVREDAASELERTLYGGLPVGYVKDILRWQTSDELESGIVSRIEAIDRAPRRISKRKDAEDHFRSPSLRKEEVFLSYSGKDAEVGTLICAALKRRFEKVFDYKDGESIRTGQPWLTEIYSRLSTAKVLVPLLSNSYFKSDNCVHEAQKIVELYDGRGASKLCVLPVKIDGEKLEQPPWFTMLQYERTFAVDNDVDALAERLVDRVKANV